MKIKRLACLARGVILLFLVSSALANNVNTKLTIQNNLPMSIKLNLVSYTHFMFNPTIPFSIAANNTFTTTATSTATYANATLLLDPNNRRIGITFSTTTQNPIFVTGCNPYNNCACTYEKGQCPDRSAFSSKNLLITIE